MAPVVRGLLGYADTRERLARRVVARYLSHVAAKWNEGLSNAEMKAKFKLLARAAKVKGDKKVANRALSLASYNSFGFLNERDMLELDAYFDKYRDLMEHPEEIEKLEQQGGGAESRKEMESKVRKRVKQNAPIWSAWKYVGQTSHGLENLGGKHDDFKGARTYELDVPGFRGVSKQYSAPFYTVDWELYKDGKLIEKGSTKHDEEHAWRTVQAWIEVLREPSGP